MNLFINTMFCIEGLYEAKQNNGMNYLHIFTLFEEDLSVGLDAS